MENEKVQEHIETFNKLFDDISILASRKDKSVALRLASIEPLIYTIKFFLNSLNNDKTNIIYPLTDIVPKEQFPDKIDNKNVTSAYGCQFTEIITSKVE